MRFFEHQKWQITNGVEYSLQMRADQVWELILDAYTSEESGQPRFQNCLQYGLTSWRSFQITETAARQFSSGSHEQQCQGTAGILSYMPEGTVSKQGEKSFDTPGWHSLFIWISSHLFARWPAWFVARLKVVPLAPAQWIRHFMRFLDTRNDR